MSDYWKKRLDELNRTTSEKQKKPEQQPEKKPADNSYWQARLDELNRKEEEKKKREEDKQDIAPVQTTKQNTLLQKGALEDGVNAKNVGKSILGTIADAAVDFGAGFLGMGEKAVDSAAQLGAWSYGGLTQQQGVYPVPVYSFNLKEREKAMDDAAEFIAKDLYDEEKIAKKIVGNVTSAAYLSNINMGGGYATVKDLERAQGMRVASADYLDNQMEADSVLGAKADSLVQSAGQLVATSALQATGIPWFLTTGVTAYGSELENAYREDATFEEAGTSAALSAVAEILTEKIGGIKFGGKSLSDALIQPFVRRVSNKAVRMLANAGIDALGEGGEEILSGLLSAVGQQMTYMDDKELNELFTSEDAFDSFMGGLILGGSSNVIGAVKSEVQGKDAVTGLTKNEQAVVDKVYKDDIAKAEAKGQKLTEKDKAKLYDKVLSDMEKGYISVKTIEEVLGGDEYSAIGTLQSEADEFNTLYDADGLKLSERQRDRLAELKQRNAATPYETALKDARSKLSQSVLERVQNDRLVESYNEQERKKQDFEPNYDRFKGSKNEEAARKTLDNAVRLGANNSNAVHDLVDMAAQFSADTGLIFDFQSAEQIKAEFLDTQGKRIAEFEKIPEAQRTAEQSKKLAALQQLVADVESGKTKVNGNITDNGIVLNLDSDKPLNRIIGHEVTHSLENAKNYEKLRDALFRYAKSKKIDIDKVMAERKLMYEGVKDADPEKELVADMVGDFLFSDMDYITDLSVNHRDIFQRIWDEIKYLCKVATAGSKEARELERVKKAFEDAYRAQKNTARSGVDYSLTIKRTDGTVEELANARDLTEDQVVGYLNQAKAGKIKGSSYIPVRKDTPQVIIDTMAGAGEVVENQSLVMQVRKAQQSMSAENPGGRSGKHGSNVRKHALTPKQVVEIVNKLDNPSMAIYQTNRHDKHGNPLPNNVAFFVEYDNNGTESVAVIEFDSSIDPEFIGKEYGDTNFHTVVTVFEPDVERDGMEFDYAEELLSNPNNIELKIERRQSEGSANREKHPNTSNELPSSEAKVPQNKPPVKQQYSLSDSDGRQLTKGQAEYFKDSKIRDENGSLKVMYHGTPNGDFTVFRDGTYFTDSKEYADRYQSPSASSISTGKIASNPKTFEVYLDIKKPFDINDAEARDIYINDYIKGGNALGINPYLSDAEYAKISTIDWTEGEDLRDFLIENEYDYDGLVLDEGGVGGYGEEVEYRGNSYVVFNSEQVKNADNLNPTKDKDIRYSLSAETDKAYMDAVNSGDTDTAQRIVEDVAKEAGYTIHSYHGTLDKNFTEFSKDFVGSRFAYDDVGFFFIDRKSLAEDYATSEFDSKRKGRVIEAYLKAEKPLIVDAKFLRKEGMGNLYRDNDTIDLWDSYQSYFLEEAEKHGADAIILDDGSTKMTVVFDSNQIKSADPITYDDNGNVIPLSERFNPDTPDIRRSLSREGEQFAPTRRNEVYGKDIRLEQDVAPVRNDGDYAYGAIERIIASGRINNTTANEIINSPALSRAFTRITGVTLEGTAEQKRTAIRQAVRERSRLAQENEVLAQEAAMQAEEDYAREQDEQTVRDSGYRSYIRGIFLKGATIADAREILGSPELRAEWEAVTGKTLPANEKSAIKVIRQTKRNPDNIALPDIFAEDIAPVTVAENTTVAEAAPMVEVRPTTAQIEDIAPGAMRDSNPTLTEKYEPSKAKQPKATPQEQVRAQILTEEPETAKKKGGAWSVFKDNFIDKGTVFETLDLRRGSRELQARFKAIGRAESKAQYFMEHGDAATSSLKSIRDTVESSGKTKDFYEYLYHQHNVDRMSLVARNMDEVDKPVFGYDVTSEMSKAEVAKLEAANPEFKEWAQEVYGYMNHLRQMLVDGGVISNDTAKLWAKKYPHYVPVRRAGYEGLNINVPLDTRRTGINAPVKKATGGNSDILPLFDTMAMRTEQTFKAVARNRFGVELKNALGIKAEGEDVDIDEAIESVDTHDELLQEGKNGMKPTFTVFEDGKKVTFEIEDEMYDTMKPKDRAYAKINNSPLSKGLQAVNNIRRNLITEYNPAFMITNPIKDTQDVLINSQHPAKTYANYPKAIAELWNKNGQYYQEYMSNGGDQNTYFDSTKKAFTKEKSRVGKVIGFPLEKISAANSFIERVPRMAEYIASRKEGRSIDVAMLDAARVTTDFSAGGDLVKLANRNGFTFLNASVQGAVQQFRNLREARWEGFKGWAKLAAKVTVAGLPAMLLNHLLWDDDEDYAELSDYVKQNYYIVGKFGDGQFVRIPKGRTLAVIQDAFEQMENFVTGNDEVDFEAFAELVVSNLAPNNPLENNIIAPIRQAAKNKAWYGGNLVPTRLQNLPPAEQYDESTDSVSRWLGDTLNISPYKINYVLDQYSGAVGDMFLPMLTPEAERGNNTLIAPIIDKFTTDSVMNNQNVSDFYDTKDKLTVNANAYDATDKDKLMSKYMNSINSELGKLYGLKRKVQNSDLSNEEVRELRSLIVDSSIDGEERHTISQDLEAGELSDSTKYSLAREIQKQIIALTKESLNTYEDIRYEDDHAIIGDRYYKKDKNGEWQKLSDDQVTKYEVTSEAGDAPYASDGDHHYRWYEPGEDSESEAGWRKITDEQLEKQEEVTSALGISPEEYWGNKEEYDYAYKNPESYAVAKAVGGYDAYKVYSSELYDIKADKDANGKSISGSRKEKVQEYINNMDADYYTKIILWKSEYTSDDSYNTEIIDYLNGREDITFEEEIAILRKLGFEVDSKGNISW